MANPEGGSGYGANGLPRAWSATVRIVGTFGLAVFLVLYYVLVMRRYDDRRYEELRDSIQALVRITEWDRTLVSAPLERCLHGLYLDVVSIDLTELVLAARGSAPDVERLGEQFQEALLVRAVSLQGFCRRDGRPVSEVLSARIRSRDFTTRLAEEASVRWLHSERHEILVGIRRELARNLSALAAGE